MNPTVTEKHFGDHLAFDRTVWMGIDQSYTGFGLTAFDGSKHETWVFKSEYRGIERLMEIEGWLEGKIHSFHGLALEGVAIEAPVLQSPSALISGQLFAIVLRKLYLDALNENARYPLQVPPTMLKKYVTGKGTGVQKNQMLLATYKAFGVEFTDDNAADSYGLARIASGFADTQYRQDVLKKLEDPKFRGR